jgi:bifunctional non-homologous end joining protein LigD
VPTNRNAAKKPPARLPNAFSPQLAVLVAHPPKGDQWLHEIKFDGYRLLAFVEAGQARLITRNGHDWTDMFVLIADTLGRLKVDSAIVDGEVVVLDDKGASDFQALQAMMMVGQRPVEPLFYAFDLPFLNGRDLTQTPLIERKARLEKLMCQRDLSPHVVYSDHFRTDGDKVLAKACAMGLEGIISKRIDAPYVSYRDDSWVKSKCQQRQEFVVIGYSPPKGQRTGFGALLLGYHDERKRLVYAGRVGTGFGTRLLGDLHQRLNALSVKRSPTAVEPPARECRLATWVKPILVAEVRFTGWTRDGMLRHPVFVALRSDKPASQIVRESPMEVDPKRRQTKTTAGRKVTTMTKSKAIVHRVAARREGQRGGDSIVAGIRLSHPDKLLYRDQGVSKRDIAEYYESVTKWMMPHVIDRPLALVRCPAGQHAKCFFQCNWSQTLPDAIDKVNVSENRKPELHVAIHDLSGLISLVQLSVLEVHTWNCTSADIEHPDQLVFDLDPGPGVTWKRLIESARLLHRTLAELRLPQFLKTSGGKGLHITVPIEPTINWDAAKRFCETIAESLAQSSPSLFVANMRKDLRVGKVYIDYHRNGRGATAVAPYSTRARAVAPISMPIAWDQLGKLSSAAQFTVGNARRYLARRRNDPWRGFERARVDLRKMVVTG